MSIKQKTVREIIDQKLRELKLFKIQNLYFLISYYKITELSKTNARRGNLLWALSPHYLHSKYLNEFNKMEWILEGIFIIMGTLKIILFHENNTENNAWFQRESIEKVYWGFKM